MQENKKNFIYLLILTALIVLLFFLIRPEKISSMEFNILDDEKLSSDDIDKNGNDSEVDRVITVISYPHDTDAPPKPTSHQYLQGNITTGKLLGPLGLKI